MEPSEASARFPTERPEAGRWRAAYVITDCTVRAAVIEKRLVPAFTEEVGKLGAHVDAMWVMPAPAVPHLRSGKLLALAVTSAARDPNLPDVPTAAETGLSGLEASLRYGLVAPAGTPRPIIERLNKELNAVLATEGVRKQLAAEGAEPLPGTPEDYAADIDREETKWSKIVKASGAKIEQ